jgi:hypothetical protein
MKESNIIGIQGVPRSGTSWLGQLINASPQVNFKFQPLFSYAFKDAINEKSSTEAIMQFFNKLSVSNDDFINMRDSDLLRDYPTFTKNQTQTHLVFKQVRYHFLIEHLLKSIPNIKFILIMRNPLEVLNSWRKAPREFNANWNFNTEWNNANLKNLGRKEEYFGYQKWREASELFLALAEKYPNNVLLIKYHNLNMHTTSVIEQIYGFLDLEIDEQVISFIDKSKNKTSNHPNSVYKSSDYSTNEYKKEIPKEIQKFVINDLKSIKLNELFLDCI